jgi:pimeloyl-ACP methyl ester carboxylesterase
VAPLVFRSERGKQLVHDQYRRLLNDWPTPHQQLRVATREGQTFVLACGSPDAPPVVLLHGGCTTSAMWLRNMGKWGERFRVYAVDLIGEPGFSAPSRPPLASDAHALWLDDVSAGLALTRMAVVGASLGGLIALDYAIRRPTLVEKLVMLAPAGIASMRYSYILKAVALFVMGPGGRRRLIDFTMGIVREELGAESAAFLAFFELVLDHFVQRSKPPPVLDDAALRRLTMPVMAVVGGRDVVFRSKVIQRRLQACVRNIRLDYLPSAGHGLVDQTSTVLDFLGDAGALLAQRPLDVLSHQGR